MENLLQNTIEVVFQGHMLYLAPFLIVMMSLLFVDRIIDLIKTTLSSKRNRY